MPVIMPRHWRFSRALSDLAEPSVYERLFYRMEIESDRLCLHVARSCAKKLVERQRPLGSHLERVLQFSTHCHCL